MLPSRDPAVVAMKVADGTVLLHTQQEVYFGLNAVGTRIWELLAEGCVDIDDLCGKLGDVYPDVEPAVLRRDAAELLAGLEAHGLVASPPPGG